MPHIIIRKATKEDLAAVQTLSQELFQEEQPRDMLLNMKWTYQKEGKEHFLKRVSGEEGICFVAEDKGKIIGYTTGSVLAIFPWRPVKRIEMENLIITAKFRGHGIGEQLVNALKQWGKEQGATRIMVSAYAANSGAIKFYERVGFVADSLQLEMSLEK